MRVREKVAPREDEVFLRQLRWTAYLAGLVGIVGLLSLFSLGARAENPPLPPGARTMGNPFPNVPPPGGRPYFDEEDDESDPDFLDDPGNYQPPSRGGIANNETMSGGSGVSMGGQSNSGGVISGARKNGKNPGVNIDSETGSGSKDVVTDFNFPDADILEIAKTLSKLTGKNLILDKDVKGKITIISNSKITVGDAWKAFLTALDINGYALIPSGNFIRIARNRDARDKQVKTYVGDYSPDTDALITRVFQLKYISAEEVARVFRSFTPANSRIVPYEQTNTVIVTDTGSNISKLAKMLEILDVEGFDAGIEVIPVKWASATELSKLIDTLIPSTGSAPGSPGGPPRFGAGGSRFAARRTKEGGIINTIIADERTNNLIIHANTKGADQVRELIAKLDQKQPAQNGGGKVHVVYLQHADAEKLSTTINNLSQASRTTAPAAAPGGGGIGINPTSQNLFEGQVKVAADASTNSLVITASPGDFVTLQRVIARLDIPRDQVYCEAIIMEVEMEKNFEFSANVINPTNGIGSLPKPTDLFGFIANPANTSGGVLGFKAGREMSFKIPGTSEALTVNSITGLLRAIQSNTKSNVLATPQIIALDNTEATFDSTESIPTSVTTVNQGVSQTTASSQKISLSLVIKPQINKMSNMIKLDVNAKLGDVSQRSVPKQLEGTAYGTLERTTKTSVVVGDSDTVVLGGLMRDKKSETVTKIPLLGDIPILGWLFRGAADQTVKSNLLVFLTPTVVRQYEKMRAVLDKKLQERDDFIEKHMGGDDPNREKRDSMIRSLPNMDELKKRPQNTVSLGDDDPAAVPVDDAPPATAPSPAAPPAGGG